jgi:hypothetical protein
MREEAALLKSLRRIPAIGETLTFRELVSERSVHSSDGPIFQA